MRKHLVSLPPPYEDFLGSENFFPADDQHQDDSSAPADSILPKSQVFFFRTNLLSPLLNVGFEVPIGEHWSVEADWHYPWFWRAGDHKNCFEALYASVGARYWLGSRHTSDTDYLHSRLLGHSVGVYANGGYYDVEHDWHGYQGNGWSAGVSYLYAMPIAKGKLHLEFEFAAGSIWSRAQPYNVKEVGGRLIRETGIKKQFAYFGPTKLGVTLVVPICRTVKSDAR